ncbi:MAG: transcriptional regulator, partial [Clostridia bacterium]|nr:transcriptional regulator [Clostridia bacterium]
MSEPINRKKGGDRLVPKGEKPPKQKREKKPDTRTKQEIIRRRLFIAATAVAAVIVVVFIASKLIFVKPPVAEEPTPPAASGEPVEGENPGANLSGRKKDFFTFLVIGRDTGGGGNTDTILLASYDVPNQKLNVMSIPRDTMVNVSWDIKRINSVYNFGGGGDKGITALDNEISQLVGFRPDFQVVVEWKAVGELVTALGGVYYDVPRNMDYEDPTQNLKIHVKKGYQKLNGDQAMQVVRFREGKNGYANGDLGRIETQQGFLKAVVEQCLKIENVARIDKLAKVFKDNVTTNLTINNLAWFAQQSIFGGLKMENVNFVTMPCDGRSVWSRSYGSYQSYVVPKTDELVALVNECFNPYLEELDSKHLDIMYVNKDGTIGSSTGVLEDKKANSAAQAAKTAQDHGLQQIDVVVKG